VTKMTLQKAFRVIGTRPVRADALDKVTGRAIFGPDVDLPGLLYGKMLRSLHPNALIRYIDTSQAEAWPGVFAVVTAKDLSYAVDRDSASEQSDLSLRLLRENVLAKEKVSYEGQAVAAVAAINPHIAEEATKLIRVEYEVLTPLMDMRQAMRENAPLVHEDMRTNSLGPDNGQLSNIAGHFQELRGNLTEGFAQADAIVDREFETSMVHQGYIEPHAATALWNLDGSLTLWSSTQGAFSIRDQVAEILDMPLSKIHVVPTEIGGGFGGKVKCSLEPVAALLSKRAGRPVKMIMTRTEVFRSSGPAAGGIIRVKMGATREGRITAAQAELYYDDGAYPGWNAEVGMRRIFDSYDIPNGQIDGYDIVTNKPYVSNYRALGAPMAAFACEQVVDELAQNLGIDPIEFRMQNVVKEGSESINGMVQGKLGAIEVLQTAKTHEHYSAPLPREHHGRGVAVGHWRNWGEKSSCTINVNADGTITLLSGSVDLSGTRTTTAMQAAEVLGLTTDQVRSSVGDTDSVGFTTESAGSRTTFTTGLAAIEAARDVLTQMNTRVASLWGVPVESVSYDGSIFTTLQDPDKRLTFRELASSLDQTGGGITGKGNVKARSWGAGFGCHIVDVAVDPETGKVTVLRYTVVQDVGRAVHPALVEGQIQGGVAQGIGWALWEGYRFGDQGRLLNPNWTDYKQPTALDVPRVDIVLVEVPSPDHPFGVRGVGEVAYVPSLAALANAVAHAIGSRMERLPMTPDSALKKMGVI
jgi:xanthine dehydrogenase molybdenum-binding subunit